MVYVANGSSTNTVRVIDTVSMSVIATVTVGAGPNGLAVSPDGKRVYVTNFSDDTVSVIGTVSNTVTSTIAVGNSPRGVAVSSDGDRIFVANSADGTLFIRG
jgi:YVTN family beta-propeller protein